MYLEIISFDVALYYLTKDEIRMEIFKGESEDDFGSDSSDDDPDFIETQEPSGTEVIECIEENITPNLPEDFLVTDSKMNMLLTRKSGYKWLLQGVEKQDLKILWPTYLFQKV